jgi:hypothetical protein
MMMALAAKRIIAQSATNGWAQRRFLLIFATIVDLEVRKTTAVK